MIETKGKPRFSPCIFFACKRGFMKMWADEKYFLRKVESLSQHIIFGNDIC